MIVDKCLNGHVKLACHASNDTTAPPATGIDTNTDADTTRAMSMLNTEVMEYARLLRTTLYSFSTNSIIDSKDIVLKCNMTIAMLSKFAVSMSVSSVVTDEADCCKTKTSGKSGCCQHQDHLQDNHVHSQTKKTLWSEFSLWIVACARTELVGKYIYSYLE